MPRKPATTLTAVPTELHDGTPITVLYMPPRGEPTANYPQGFQPNPIAAWCSQFHGRVNYTVREIWQHDNGLWYPGKLGHNVPVTAAPEFIKRQVKALAAAKGI